MLQVPFGRVAHGRLVLYVLLFPGAVALDVATPLGIADWLIEVILLSIASVWGTRRELRVVLLLASATVIAGLFISPATTTPFATDALNRMAAILVMGAMAQMAERSHLTEVARRESVAELKLLRKLLPICAGCRSIKDGTGEWHRLERFLAANSDIQVTHGLCPTCFAKYMAEVPGAVQKIIDENS
jgi:hypothetical protein